MTVDAILIVCAGVHKIIGSADHCRELVAGLRVEIGVTSAGIYSAVADAEIGQILRRVKAGRNVASDVGHVTIDALVPAQGRYRIKVAEPGGRLAPAARDYTPAGTRERTKYGARVVADEATQAQRGLTSEDRRGEYVVGVEILKINFGV